MSTTFSLVVYVKRPHARPNRPSAIRIIPSVLFTVISFRGRQLGATEQSEPCLRRELGALPENRSIHFSSTSSICPTFFWILPVSFSFWPSVSRLGLFVPFPTFSSTAPFTS